MFTKSLTFIFITFLSFNNEIQSCKLDEFKAMWDENVKNFKHDKPSLRTEEFSNYTQTYCQDAGDFDFIIIGAGTSGSIIANRLSEIVDWHILVLEAGDEESSFLSIPAAYNKISSKHTWPYKTTKQDYACFESNNNECRYGKGKSLGGTSAIDRTFYARGNQDDYDQWERMGNIGWDYNTSLPYFKKSENARDFIPDRDYHGYTGERIVSTSTYNHPLLETLSKLNEEFGQKLVDYNGKSQMGYSKLQIMVDNGKRESTNAKFLQPIRVKRYNLTILTKAMVIKLEFINKNAYKVIFLHDGDCKYVIVRKEVILAAGVINSPQLLQLSGIGPKDLLENLNITVLADLPVGKNFSDAVCFNSGIPILTNSTFIIKPVDEAIYSYLGGTGPLSTPEDLLVSHHTIRKGNKPDLALLYGFQELTIGLDLKNTVPIETRSVITIKPELLYPNSRGMVSIKSNDPFVYPEINPRIFEEKSDLNDMLYAMKLIMDYSKGETLKAVDGYIETRVFSKCLAGGLRNKELWLCVIKEKAVPCLSGLGTCRMGSSPIDSVVDSDLKLHGFNKIRIADASVLPGSTGSKIGAAVMMIAEKVSDLIKKTHQAQKEILKWS